MTKRTLRLSLVAATVLILPGVSPAAGQSEAPVESAAPVESPAPLDPVGANYWTGTWTFTPGEGVAGTVAGLVEADDPRIAGTMSQVSNGREMASVDPSDGNVGFVNGTVRIDNDAGAWVGTWTGFSDGASGEEWYVVEGEGAYEGLTAVYSWHSDDSSFRGVILPAELPVPPDSIALPTE